MGQSYTDYFARDVGRIYSAIFKKTKVITLVGKLEVCRLSVC